MAAEIELRELKIPGRMAKDEEREQGLWEDGPEGTLEPESTDKHHPSVRWVCGLCSLTGLIMGFEVGTTDQLVNSQELRLVYGELGVLVKGITLSAFNLGCVVGCLAACALLYYGLRLHTVVKTGYAIYTTASVMNAISLAVPHIGLFISYRIVCGISGGLSMLVVPMYITKVTVDDTQRGSNLSLFQLIICLGILMGNLGSVVGIPVMVMPYIINGVIIVNSLLTYWYLPPIVAEPGQQGEAEKVPTFKWNKLAVAVYLMVFQQLTGINFFFYYSTELFPNTTTIVMLAAVNLFGSVVNVKIIDMFTRKTLLISGSLLTSVLLLCYWYWHHFIIIYAVILVFAMTWGPVSSTMMNELANFQVLILTVSILSNFMTNFILISSMPLLFRTLQHHMLFLFIGAMVVLVGVTAFLPETKNRSLDEIDTLFETST